MPDRQLGYLISTDKSAILQNKQHLNSLKISLIQNMFELKVR